MSVSSKISSYRLPESGSKIPELDGLRGVAILLVMLLHFTSFGRMSPGIVVDTQIRNILLSGWVGVDLFFVLSGFLITGILIDSKQSSSYLRNFFARRILRIFPLYYFTLLLVFIVIPLSHRVSPDYLTLLDQQAWYWTYLVNIDFALHGWPNKAMIGHFWSLAVEEQFYLLWPFVVLVVSRKGLAVTCGILTFFGLILRIGLALADLNNAAYVLTPARMDTLAVGALVAVALRSELGRAHLARWTVPILLASGAGIATLFLWNDYLNITRVSVLGIGLTLLALFFGGSLVVAVCGSSSNRFGRFLNSPILSFFGRYSYGLYVFHHFVAAYLPNYLFRIDRFPRIFDSQLPGLVIFCAVGMFVSVVLALLSWHLLEARFLALKRAFEHVKPPLTAPQVPV